MCGRFTLTSDPEIIEKRFRIANIADLDIKKRYNIAPTQEVLAVIHDGANNRAGYLRFGLIPSFAKDTSIGNKLINARAETIDEKVSFKHLLVNRRCLIIADSFYEWKRQGKSKQPYRIKLKNNEPFAFAGLWDRYQKDGKNMVSCTIITTKANGLLQELHDRMPVILSKKNEEAWLDQSIENVVQLKEMLTAYDEKEMEMYKVSSLINSPKNDINDCINPI